MHRARCFVSGLIIHNGVQRIPYAFEDTPGFHQVDPQGNHTVLLEVGDGQNGTITGAQVLRSSLARLDTDGTKALDGYTYVMVLGEDQAALTFGKYFLGPGFAYTGAQKTTIIIVSDSQTDERTIPAQTNGMMLLTVRYGINLILGRNVVIDIEGATKLEGPVMVESGAKFILDGGHIRNHNVGDYGRAGGVHSTCFENNGAYIIINDGTITGNTSGGQGGAGGVSIGLHGTVLIQGGEISGNSSPVGGKPRAGGVSINFNNNNGTAATSFTDTHHGTYSFFMTDGVIKDNTISGVGAGAGGVLTMGAFQKTGGVIEAETVEGSGTIKAGAVAVLKGPAHNPAATEAFIRNTESGQNNTLVIECVKPAAASPGELSVPAWSANNWD